MATKERYQNPAVGDNINLRFFTYNSNAPTNVFNVEKVDIYYLDPDEKTSKNPDGRRLIESFTGSSVANSETGNYLINFDLPTTQYVIGKHIDSWTIKVADDEASQTIENIFEIYPQLWYTTPTPIVYDFKFHFQPNKLRKGSKQYLIIEIMPNVPRSSDLDRYYQNLAISSDLKVSMEQKTGDCLPEEKDLRLKLDKVAVDYREQRHGYYQLDTTDLDCGIYDLWFQLDFGGNIYISDRMQLQIFE